MERIEVAGKASKKTKTEFDHTDSETIFANIIGAQWNPEDIVLSFGLRDEMTAQGKIRASHRLGMTIPHFVRTVQLFNGILADLEKKGIIQRVSDGATTDEKPVISLTHDN